MKLWGSGSRFGGSEGEVGNEYDKDTVWECKKFSKV